MNCLNSTTPLYLVNSLFHKKAYSHCKEISTYILLKTSQRQLAAPTPSNKFVNAGCGGPLALCPTLTSALLRQMFIEFGSEEHSTKLNAKVLRQAQHPSGSLPAHHPEQKAREKHPEQCRRTIERSRMVYLFQPHLRYVWLKYSISR